VAGAAVAEERTAQDAGPHLGARIDPRLVTAMVVLVAMGLSLALGLHDLAGRPLSQDEASSFTDALAPDYSRLTALGGDFIVYFLLLRGVVDLFGSSLIAVRLPSVLAGVAVIPIVFLIGNRLGGQRVGRFACLLSAISLPAVFWQQNARAYSLGALLVAGSMLAFLVMIETPSPIARYAYVGVTIIACYTLSMACLVLPAQMFALALGTPRRAHWRTTVPPIGVVVLGCIPLALLSHHVGSAPISWIPRPTPGSLVMTARMLVSAADANGPPTTSPIAVALAIVSLAACAIGSALLIVRARRGRFSDPARAAALCGLWLVTPPLAAYAVSLAITTHIYLDRYFVMDLPAAALLLAIVLGALAPRAVAYLAIALLAAARLAMIPSSFDAPDEISQAAAYILANSRPGDCITFNTPQAPTTEGIASELAYYQAHAPAGEHLPLPALPPFSWEAAASASFVMPTDSETFTTVMATCKRLWFAVEPPSRGQIPWYRLQIGYFVREGWPLRASVIFPSVYVALVGPSTRT
jgi:mannosyltransferase